MSTVHHDAALVNCFLTLGQQIEVTDSPSALMYVRDLERIFDPSLEPVEDKDGRTQWP